MMMLVVVVVVVVGGGIIIAVGGGRRKGGIRGREGWITMTPRTTTTNESLLQSFRIYNGRYSVCSISSNGGHLILRGGAGRLVICK